MFIEQWVVPHSTSVDTFFNSLTTRGPNFKQPQISFKLIVDLRFNSTKPHCPCFESSIIYQRVHLKFGVFQRTYHGLNGLRIIIFISCIIPPLNYEILWYWFLKISTIVIMILKNQYYNNVEFWKSILNKLAPQ